MLLNLDSGPSWKGRMASCGKLHFVLYCCRALISFTPFSIYPLCVYRFLSGNVLLVLLVKYENKNDTTKPITKINLHRNTTSFPWNILESTCNVDIQVQKCLKYDTERWAGAAIISGILGHETVLLGESFPNISNECW